MRRSSPYQIVIAGELTAVRRHHVGPLTRQVGESTGRVRTEMLDVGDADEDDLYEAMDWLLDRQRHIEKKLGARHLHADGLALDDLTSSCFEGVTCPLAAFGHNRDDAFDFRIIEEKVAAEAALDGIYVIRTSLPAERMDAAQTVRGYKLLSQAERTSS